MVRSFFLNGKCERDEGWKSWDGKHNLNFSNLLSKRQRLQTLGWKAIEAWLEETRCLQRKQNEKARPLTLCWDEGNINTHDVNKKGGGDGGIWRLHCTSHSFTFDIKTPADGHDNAMLRGRKRKAGRQPHKPVISIHEIGVQRGSTKQGLKAQPR